MFQKKVPNHKTQWDDVKRYCSHLDIYSDADLSMQVHVTQCFAALCQLCQICRAVPTATFQTLIVALVHSRLNYGNAVLVSIPAHLVRRLQSVLNMAVRLIYHDTALATCPRTRAVQNRGANGQSASRQWRRAAISGTSCRHH